MRKLLGTVLLLLVLLGVVGMFRGWFAVSTNSESDRTKIEMTIDREKFKQDAERLKEGVEEFSGKLKSEPDSSPTPQP